MIRKTIFWMHLGTGVVVGLAAALAAGADTASAQDVGDARTHAERGLQAAADFPGYASLCDLDMTFRNVNVLVTDPPRTRTTSAQPAANTTATEAQPVADTGATLPQPAATTGSSTAAANAGANTATSTAAQQRTRTVSAPPPAQVFDNLFFVGSESVSSWLLGTEEGYILIDAMNSDEEAESIIEAGIVSLGLDPAMIRYLLVTHAHGDHFGGYEYIGNRYSPRIVMSELDWDLASRLAEHPRFGLPPARDVSVNDGDQLTAGTTTLDIRVTPGHTPGTISPVFTVYDNGTPYRAILWGGTGFNFGPNYEQMSSYAASANRMKQLAVEENVRVFLSNHSRRDGSLERIAELAGRGPGDPHPFVQGEELHAVFDVLEQCALAQAARIRDGDR